MFNAAIAANTAALAAGTMPDSPFTMGFGTASLLRWRGMTLCLIIAIFLCSKRDEEKAIAKLGFLPGICGISEPVVFGIPLVLNPIYAIPFAFGSGICVAIAMFATSIGFLPATPLTCPLVCPSCLMPLLAMAGRVLWSKSSSSSWASLSGSPSSSPTASWPRRSRKRLLRPNGYTYRLSDNMPVTSRARCTGAPCPSFN